MGQTQVALTRGEDRYATVRQALELIAGATDFARYRSIVIKPNFVATDKQLACTHVDAVRATIDVLRERGAGKLILAEGAALGATEIGFRNFGYLPLLKEYNDIEFRDLNRDDAVRVQVFDRNLKPMTLRLARTIVESDMRISVCPPKTHDTVVVTASLKNVLMGTLIIGRDGRGPHLRLDPDAPALPLQARPSLGLGRKLRAIAGFLPLEAVSPVGMWLRTKIAARVVRSDKVAMHQSIPVINLNLARLTRTIAPHLAVIDGHVGMEGNGPVYGTPVPWGIALASFDSVAADSVAARLMGFDPNKIGYLTYCAEAEMGVMDPEQIVLVGDVPVEEVQRSFRPHETVQAQLQWQTVSDADHLVTAP